MDSSIGHTFTKEWNTKSEIPAGEESYTGTGDKPVFGGVDEEGLNETQGCLVDKMKGVLLTTKIPTVDSTFTGCVCYNGGGVGRVVIDRHNAALGIIDVFHC